ncbi:MAG TPA: pyruvate dehydrogenase (acetyl-transferring) E1 component subunit alpha [Thermoanaerobaculia bacterium]|nr:pyruvate dehydrogenase (acetyl-transferring) E1 component subunit alpha [Thermoanaerobaculia bacterium]
MCTRVCNVEMAKAKPESTATIEQIACAPEWTDILRQMILIRRFEEASEREFRRGKIGGYLHVYIGQEAVASGVISALQKDDLVFCGYRDHAHALALGSEPGRVMAELFGKATGVSKGKGGSMHLFDVERGLYGGYGIVGGHLPLAAGSAYGVRYQETDRIVVCYFGDGAMNIGSFHEAMNMAGLWGKEGMCPVLFIIENNGYAMGTSVERHSAVTDLSARVRAYDIETEKVDGQDVFAIRGAADRVVRQIRETGRPYCLEAVTYRFSGHGAADILQPYRSKKEVEQHKDRDPIVIMRKRLGEVCGLTDDDVQKMEEWAAEEVAKAVKFAEESPAPEPEELFHDVVAEHGPRPVAESETE